MSMYEEDDEPTLDSWDSSSGLHFSIDFDLNNRHLSQKQRDVIRKMIFDLMQQATVKMQLLGIPEGVVRVFAEERASGTGTRRMRIPREVTKEEEDGED